MIPVEPPDARETRKRRIGIVGLGSIASRIYLPLLCPHPEIEVAGLFSRSAETVEARGEQYGVTGRFTELAPLLEAGPEVVFVHSPTATHPEIVTECLKAGAHVFVDKPLAYTLAEAERMSSLARDRGLLLAVGFNRRFAPMYREARDWMGEGGGIEFASTFKIRPASQQAPVRETVYDDLIHLLDVISWLGDGTAELLHSKLDADAEGRLVTAVGTLELGQAVAQFGMQRASGGGEESLGLYGGGRHARVSGLERGEFAEGGERFARSPGDWDTVARRRGFVDMVDHVLGSLSDPASCEVEAGRVLPAHRLCEDILQRSGHG